MIVNSFLLFFVLAGQPSASAKGLGDVLKTIEDVGKSVSKNKKDTGSENESAQEAADDEKSSAVGGVLKAVGIKGKTADGIQKSVGFGVRTKKNVESARDLDPEGEWQIGRVASAELMVNYKPLGDEALNDYVQTVGQAVAMSSDRPQTFSGYHFQVLDSEEINALSVLGGYVFVTKGMLRLLENEDQLACVLAHEVAHVALGHGAAAIAKARRMKATIGIAADASKTYGSKSAGKDLAALKGDVKSFMEILNRTGYGQSKEYEADEKGAVYAQRTGYDPSAMAEVLRKLEVATGKQGGFLKTHPKADKRAKLLEEQELEPPSWYRESPARAERFAAALAVLSGPGR